MFFFLNTVYFTSHLANVCQYVPLPLAHLQHMALYEFFNCLIDALLLQHGVSCHKYENLCNLQIF